MEPTLTNVPDEVRIDIAFLSFILGCLIVLFASKDAILFHLGTFLSVLHGGVRLWFAKEGTPACRFVGVTRILLLLLLLVVVYPLIEMRGDFDTVVVWIGAVSYCLSVVVPEAILLERGRRM